VTAAVRVAIIGCGAIGSVLAKAVDEGYVDVELVALMDIVKEKCSELAASLGRCKPDIVTDIDELLAKEPDVVVEAASQQAVRDYAKKILSEGISLVVLSVGALMDSEFLKELEDLAHRHNAYIYIPSGAIAGLDAVKALRRVGFRKILLRTRKPPKSLRFSKNYTLQLSRASGPVTIYKGVASEAVKLLPFNINVAATLSLAAGKDVEVEVLADPSIQRNVHEIVIESPASNIVVRVENVPSPENPRTSYLAALSAIELLRRIAGDERIIVGT